MKKIFVVIGLGSMGKRRIRNLQALGFKEIIGVDNRKDRREEVSNNYFVETFQKFESVIELYSNKIKALIISVPPAIHSRYIEKAVLYKIPCFVEASVLKDNLLELDRKAIDSNVLIAPSCTLYFHPAIKLISKLLLNNELGKISNLIYHSGQFLPDWHKFESVAEYYVSKKETGGAREIVPFKLTWITMLLGYPIGVTGLNKKTIKIEGAKEIDDTYNILLDYDDFIFNLSVDVVSRFATRRLLINGDKKQLIWDWNKNEIKVYDPLLEKWAKLKYKTMPSSQEYNKNLTEQMYVDEIDSFIRALEVNQDFPNSLKKDMKVLDILYLAEKSCIEKRILSK